MPLTLEQSLSAINSLIATAGQFRQAELERTETQRQFNLQREDQRGRAAIGRDVEALRLLSDLSPEDAATALSVFETESPFGAEMAGSLLSGFESAAERLREEKISTEKQREFQNWLDAYEVGAIDTPPPGLPIEAETTIDDNPLGLDIAPMGAGLAPAQSPRPGVGQIPGQNPLQQLINYLQLTGKFPFSADR